MQALTFLRAVWPTRGLYCIARPNDQGLGYRHTVFEDIEGAAEYVELHKDTSNIFFCVHTLLQPKVWNATAKTASGKVGKWEVRVQSNTRECKAFFFDLDVGESTERVKKYETQEAAVTGLKEFCIANKLPRPAIVSSGGGLHVYWTLDDAIPSAQWKPVAQKLKTLALASGLLIDVARTTDNSSVLRVAGTFNLKHQRKRPVEVKLPFKAVSLESFENAIDEALESVDQPPTAQAAAPLLGTMPAGPMPKLDGVKSNIDDKFADVEPVEIRTLAHSCEQVKNLLLTTAEHTEPEWYHLLNLVRFVKDAKRYIHAVSKDHKDYTPAGVDAKVDQLERKGVGPTTCAKLQELGGLDICKRCPHYQQVKSPLVAARRDEQADAPVVTREIEGETVEIVIPPPPPPYTRRKNGTIAAKVVNADNETKYIQILHHDLYPVRRLSNKREKLEQQVWRANLPKVGEQEFTIDADCMYDRRKFAAAISNQGIYPPSQNIQQLQDYMIAYIAKLQQEAEADQQYNHLGWTDEFKGFIMPDRVLMTDGKAKAVSLTLHAQRGSAWIQKAGSMTKQVQLMEFFNEPRHFPTQFMIMCSLAAPIFYKTGQFGCVVAATGKTGTGKSTTLYAACSMWGHASKYALSGTASGATPRARAERITTLANLPVCVDEITHLDTKEAHDLAMSATQPGERIRLTQTGVEQATSESERATLMLTTGNISLHSLLAAENNSGTASSMRVIEFMFKKLRDDEKVRGDDFMRELRENFGHIGPRMLQYYVPNMEKIGQRMVELGREIDKRAKLSPPERFWSAAMASALTAGEIAHDLGLLPFDTEKLMDWLCDVQVPQWRGVVADEYDTPLGLVADYLSAINENIVAVEKAKDGSGHTFIMKEARGKLLARLDKTDKMIWIAKSEFRAWCSRKGANDRLVIEELHQKTAEGKHDRIVPHTKSRKMLGAGTDVATAQVWCFGLNLAHPEVSGMVDVEVVSNEPTVKVTRPLGRLRVIEDDA